MDGNTQEQERELVELNRLGLQRLCLVFLGVGGIDLLMGLLSMNRMELRHGAVITALSVGLWSLIRLLTQRAPSRRRILGLFYGAVCLMLLVGVWSGTFDDPEQPAFTFPLVLLALPVFLTDRPLRQLGFAWGMSAVFLVCSALAKSGSMFVIDLRHILIVLFVNAVSVAMLTRDKNETMRQEQELKDTTFRDAMTGLYNKRGVERICSWIESGVEGTLILLDLDHFKDVNDNFGHAVGDMVLNHVAFAMRRSFRSSDLLLRIGGDEFAVYAIGLLDRDGIRDKLAQLRAAVADDARGCPHVTCSLGAAVWQRSERDGNSRETYAELFRRADAALYQAKESGRNRWVIAE